MLELRPVLRPGPLVAYCYASGHLMFAPELPWTGELAISWCKRGASAGEARKWKSIIEAHARLGYDGVTHFVPGIPEAWHGAEFDSEKALEALHLFCKRVERALLKQKLTKPFYTRSRPSPP